MITSTEHGKLVHRLHAAPICICGAIATTIVSYHDGYSTSCDRCAPETRPGYMPRCEPIDRSFRISPIGYTNVDGFGLLAPNEITRNRAGRVASVNTAIGDRQTLIRTRGLTWKFATGSAWRAIYLSWNDRQRAHIGIDPNTHDGASVFGSLPWIGSWRVYLPVVRFAFPMSRTRSFFYRLQNRVLAKIDGRY